MGTAFKTVIGGVIALLITGNTLLVKQSLGDARTPTGDESSEGRLVAAEARSSALEQLRPDLAAAQAKIEQLTKADADKQALLAQIDSGDKDSVTVTGLGRINSRTDLMRFSVGVSARRATVREAWGAASATASRVVAALKSRGIKDEDIQTQWLSLGRSWNPNEPGYVAGNSVDVKLRDLDGASDTLAAAIEAGGDETHLGGATFILEENSKPMIAVRRAAYSAARKKAEEYAEMSGRKLGKVLLIHEGDSSPPPPITRSAAQGFDASSKSLMPIERGTAQQMVIVTLIFQLI